MHVKLCFYSMVRYRVQTTTLCEGPFIPSASTSVDESEARCATDVYGRRRARCEWALRHYIREVNDSTALEFWQEDEHYHVLSKMARIYSGISPDSVPLKSLFSCAGFMLNSRRSVTAPYKADMVTFVHDNYDVVM